MQYKKEDVKNKLIEAGEEEFFLYEFSGSSIRRIVKSAGTTIGNFYNYFINKEDLFSEIVGSELKRFNDFVDGHGETGNADFLWNVSDASVWNKVLEENVGVFMPVFTRRFYILIACSGGTAYENSREKVLGYIKLHFIEHALENKSLVEELEHTARVLAHEFLEGILYIIKMHEKGPEAEILIRNHMLFFYMGTMGMLKGLQGQEEA